MPVMNGLQAARAISKRLGPYEPMPMTWFKVLNPYYTQKRGRKELFEGFRERSTWVLDITTGSRNDPEPPPFSTSSVFSPSSSETQQHHPRTASLQSS